MVLVRKARNSHQKRTLQTIHMIRSLLQGPVDVALGQTLVTLSESLP